MLERSVPSWCGPQELTSISRACLIVVGCGVTCQLLISCDPSMSKRTMQCCTHIKPRFRKVREDGIHSPAHSLYTINQSHVNLEWRYLAHTSIIWSGSLTVHTNNCLFAALHSALNFCPSEVVSEAKAIEKASQSFQKYFLAVAGLVPI